MTRSKPYHYGDRKPLRSGKMQRMIQIGRTLRPEVAHLTDRGVIIWIMEDYFDDINNNWRRLDD